MTARRIAYGALALLAGLGALAMPAQIGAQTSSGLRQAAVDSTSPRDLSAPAADPVQGGKTPPGTEELPGTIRMQGPVARERELRGNPLWGIPLRSLTATRERPLFTPTRRPPAPAVAGPPPVEAPAPPPAGVPDRPLLTLVGAISGETEGIAIFLDQITRDIVRLRTGESHSGWTLLSVKGREAALVKDQCNAIPEVTAGDGLRRSETASRTIGATAGATATPTRTEAKEGIAPCPEPHWLSLPGPDDPGTSGARSEKEP